MSRGKPSSYCKPCASARAKAHYQANHERGLKARAEYREAHRGEWSAYFREYRAANAGRIAERERLRRAADAERLRALGRARYRSNPRPYIERARRWSALNPEKASAHALKKNHRRRGAELDSDARAYATILRRDPCCYCGVRGERIEIDHIAPIRGGGDGQWTNLTAACRACNAAKGGRSLLSFLLERIAS